MGMSLLNVVHTSGSECGRLNIIFDPWWIRGIAVFVQIILNAGVGCSQLFELYESKGNRKWGSLDPLLGKSCPLNFHTDVSSLIGRYKIWNVQNHFSQVIRRTGPEEKYLILARKRKGHVCDESYIVALIVAWEGISQQYANDLYGYLCQNLNNFGFHTRRRCGMNERYVFLFVSNVQVTQVIQYMTAFSQQTTIYCEMPWGRNAQFRTKIRK